MTHPLRGAFDALYLACIWIAAIAVAVMSVIIPIGVFARYVLGFGAQWPEPIAILLMVIFTFFGAAAAYRANSHIAVAMVTDRLPLAWQRPCRTLVSVLLLLVSLFMLYYGGKLCLETMGQTLAALPWLPIGVTYLPVPVGGLLTLVFVVETLIWGPQHTSAVVTFDHPADEAVA